MDRVTYHEQTDMENILKLREVLRTLPEFSRDYFRAIDSTTTTKTRISYAYDIRIFFQFLVNENPLFKDKKITEEELQTIIHQIIFSPDSSEKHPADQKGKPESPADSAGYK